MKVSAIEIGTNSIKFLIARFDAGKMEIIEKCSVVNRLSRNMYGSNQISNEAIENTIRIIGEFIKKSENQAAKLIAVFSTSVLRDALNRDLFMNRVQELYGISIEVISGDREAFFAFKACAGLLGDGVKNVAVIDIGGGSTEISIGNQQNIINCSSCDIGAVRLTEMFVHHDPVSQTEINEMKQYIHGQLDHLTINSSLADFSRVAGIGGTIKSLATIDARIDYNCEADINGRILTMEKIETIFQNLKLLTTHERVTITGLNPKRADVIVAGVTILLSTMKYLNCHAITVSARGAIEGYVEDFLLKQ